MPWHETLSFLREQQVELMRHVRLPTWIAVLLCLCGSADAADFASRAQIPTIDEWPTALRTDLRGSKLIVDLPENANDARWDDALVAKFSALTGIAVTIVRPGNDLTAVLGEYQKQFAGESPPADVYAIDVVWPGIFGPYAMDLSESLGGAVKGSLPALIENDTRNGRLVAAPYFVEMSVLFYRRDLLHRYGITHPPRTWDELEQQARAIQEGERKRSSRPFWGFLWQGNRSETLTCNAFEWQVSQGAGALLRRDGAVDFNASRAARAFECARGWLGSISPPQAIDDFEDQSLAAWKRGEAAFMRNWPYAFPEGEQSGSAVRGSVGIAALPRGTDPSTAAPATLLGGFQLMIHKDTTNAGAAVEFVRFMTSPQIQRVNAIARGYAPTRLELYDDPRIRGSNPVFAGLKEALTAGAMTRPSTVAGARYSELSAVYFDAVHRVLTGAISSGDGAREIENKLRSFAATDARDF
jgi:trehalose/maltose transport system substrate-binding protein